MNELKLSDLAKYVLEQRYLAPGETPVGMLRRVAKAVASAESPEKREEYEDKFFQMMANMDFLPNSPTLMNAGRPLGQLSACFVLPIEDSMEDICFSLMHQALIHKSGGGTGFNFSRLRPEGATVGSTGGQASGPISFMNVFNSMTETVKQGGKRRGANMGMLRVDHPDILAFIDAKLDKTKLTNFNLSIAITDEFMEAVITGSKYALRHNDQSYGELDAQMVFRKIAQNAWQNGEPGIVFIDRVNASHPIKEEVESTNPCWTGDTKVWTINGHERFCNLIGKEVPVLTQTDAGELCFRTMRNIRITAEKADICEVFLDNGAVMRCTPNHQLYLRNGEVVCAKDLIPGSRLSSMYRFKANSKGYLAMRNGFEQVMEHWVVGSHKYGRRPSYPDEHCHHLDGVKSNNTPSNLEYKPFSIHNSEHMLGDGNPMRGIWDERNPLFGVETKGSSNGRFRHDVSTEEIVSMRESGATIKGVAKAFGCSEYTVKKRYREHKLSICNHRVLEVRNRINPMTAPVYNGTVDETHRYFVVTGDNCAILSKNCGEQPLLPNESCNLGSINLSNMVKPHGKNFIVDWDKLDTTVRLAVRFLDNVIDVNKFPLPQIETKTKENRKIGLGVMGLADMFIKLGYRYDSAQAVKTSGMIAHYIQTYAEKATGSLAVERGAFPNIANVKPGAYAATAVRRNATLTTVAPTGTLSIIADCSGGVEPNFAYEMWRDHAGSKQKCLHPMWAEHINDGLYERDLFVEAGKIGWEWHVKQQAAWQNHTDNAVSKTINMAPEATVEDVESAYQMAYAMNCKGLTIYRDGSRDGQVLSKVETTDAAGLESTISAGVQGGIVPKPRPVKVDGSTTKVDTGCGSMLVVCNQDVDGSPFEVVVTHGTGGGCMSQSTAIGRLISLAQRCGVDQSVILKMIKGIRCPACTNRNLGVLSCPDAIARIMEGQTITANKQIVKVASEPCPECGKGIVHANGCTQCPDCGWSKCS